MVIGLDRFKQHFAPYANQYVLIGGTACSIIMQESGLDFRSTKDFDIVLYVEALDTNFVDAFWKFIKDGSYENRQQSTGKEIFYRFSSPSTSDFPSMLELFSRVPDKVPFSGRGHLTPIPVHESVASLSAILLDDNYYNFIQSGMQHIDSLPILDALHLIPLKARAFLDLMEQKKNGISIDEKDIRKHKNDVIRLYQLLTSNSQIELSSTLKKDMSTFLKTIFWQHFGFVSINERQRKIVNLLLDAGKGQFVGGLTTRKYVSIAKVSRATAFREISDLIHKKMLVQNPSKGRNISYELNWDEANRLNNRFMI